MKIIRNIFVLGLVNFVLVLGVLAAAQTANNFTDAQPIPSPTSIVLTVTPTSSIQNIKKESVEEKPTEKIKPKVTQQPTPTINNTPNPTPTSDPLAGKCIIYIDSVRYDMTEFKKIHSGGDIFQCGTDMSDIFHGQHPSSYLEKIAKYKI